MAGPPFFARPGVASGLALSVDGAPPEIGALTRRVHGMAAVWPSVTPIAEKYFGPFNPRRLSDPVLKLMSTDWSIGFARDIVNSAFPAAEYRFEGGPVEIRSFLETAVIPRLAQWIEAMLRALEYGRQSCEVVWGLQDGKYVVDEMRDLDPELVEILADEATGDYRGLRYQGREIPGNRTLHVVNEQEFGNLFGRSQHVRAYNPWWWGNLTYLGLNRYLERKGDPPLIGFAPGEEVADDNGNVQDPVRVTATGLANLKSGGAYVFPQEYDPDSKQPLYAVRALEVAERAPEFLATIDVYERHKRLAWLIPYSVGGGGSFAADKVAVGIVHRLFDRRLQLLILDPLNKHVIPKLVRYNFGVVKEIDVPRLTAGSMADNARELFSEILRAAINLEGTTPDGRAVRIVQMIDWMKALRGSKLPLIDEEKIPDPPPIEVGAGAGGARGAPGRPARITPEPDRPAAPSRPGLARAALAADPPDAEAWLSGVTAGLADVDKVVWQTEALMESERRSVEAEIRNIMRKAILSAKQTDGRLHAANRDLAADVERQVADVLEASLFEDMLDEADLTKGSVTLARRKVTPLARQHAEAAKAAAKTAQAAGVAAPSAATTLRAVKDVLRDAARNGRGVVIRESRRVAETVDRLVQGESPAVDAEAAVDAYELPTKEWVESTVHHVRGSARAVLAKAGTDAGAESWLVTSGPGTEAEVLDKFPRGDVAEQLWTVKTTSDLDAIAKARAASGAPVSSWRNLGLNFFSEEMYVPVGAALLAAVAAAAAERRRRWNEDRTRRQAEIDRLAAERP